MFFGSAFDGGTTGTSGTDVPATGASVGAAINLTVGVVVKFVDMGVSMVGTSGSLPAGVSIGWEVSGTPGELLCAVG